MSKPNKQRYSTGQPPLAAKDYFNALRPQRLPVPAVGIFDEPTRCYKLNLEWASHIEGAIEVLAEWTAWLGEDDERNIAVQQIREFLLGSECVDCNEVINCLNQNPDYIAFQGVQLEAMSGTTEEFLADLEAQYDGNPNSINPSIPTDEPDLASEENALCYAIKSWVNLYCENKKAAIRQASFLSQAWNALQNAIEGAYGVISNITGFNLLDDLFACFVDNATALTALDDESAKSDIVCCLYGELKDIALVENSLEGAINACLGSLVGTAHDLLCLISNDLNLQHTLNFFFIYGRSLDRQLSGEILPLCDCENWQWTYIDYDFTVSNHGFVVMNGRGTWQAGIGYVGTNQSPQPENFDRLFVEIQKIYATTDYKIGAMGIHTERLNQASGGMMRAFWGDGVTAFGRQVSPAPSGDVYRTYSDAQFLSNQIYALSQSADEPIASGATLNIKKVRVWLAPDSPQKGIPHYAVPVGLPVNGSADLGFWT